MIPRDRARRAKTERAQWSRDHQTNNTVLPPPSFGENGGRPTPTSSSSSSSLLFSRRRRRPPSQATDVGDAATDVVDLLRNAALRPAVVIPRNRIRPDRGWIPCDPGRSPKSSPLRGEEQRAGDKEEEARNRQVTPVTRPILIPKVLSVGGHPRRPQSRPSFAPRPPPTARSN